MQAYLSDHRATIFQRGQVAGSRESTLAELFAGFWPGVVVWVANFFEVDTRILQEQTASGQLSRCQIVGIESLT